MRRIAGHFTQRDQASFLRAFARTIENVIFAIGGILLFGTSLRGQSPVTFQYVYDDLNQLVKVVDSTGVSVDYIYDAVGNMVQVKRSTITPGALSIFGVTPQTVGTGGTLTIQGQGFSTTPRANVVTLGGLSLTVLSSTSSLLVVQIPSSATSGIISVTVGSATATTLNAETVIPIPTILSVLPKAALAGTSFPVTVTGTNLAGSSFSFGSPSRETGRATVNAARTGASFVATLDPGVKGYCAVVARNVAGPSSSYPPSGSCRPRRRGVRFRFPAVPGMKLASFPSGVDVIVMMLPIRKGWPENFHTLCAF